MRRQDHIPGGGHQGQALQNRAYAKEGVEIIEENISEEGYMMHNMHRYTNSTRVDNKLSVLFFITTALDFRPNSHTQAHDVENVITRHTRDLIWIGFVDFICFLSCPCGFLRTLFFGGHV